MFACVRHDTGDDTIGAFIEKESLGWFHAARRETRKELLQKRSPACIAKCSATGPSVSAGRKVSPPTITITPVSKAMKRRPVVGRVPTDDGVMGFAASDPAMARTGMTTRKRPRNMAKARLRSVTTS